LTSPEELLSASQLNSSSCVILDLELQGISGLDVQQFLNARHAPAIVFTTERADIATCVRAMRRGAIDVLQKPLTEDCLLRAITEALEFDRATRAQRSELAELRKHYATLTPRQREVLPLVTAGFLNKQTAAEIGTSEITVCVHRAQIMRKMAAHSFAELVRMADKLGLQSSSQMTYAGQVA
jgi:FixJ family two-component response regulator